MDLSEDENGKGLILSFRTLQDGPQTVLITLELALLVHEIIIEHYMPSQMLQFELWRAKEMGGRLVRK